MPRYTFLGWNVANAVHFHITSSFRQSPLSGHLVLTRQLHRNWWSRFICVTSPFHDGGRYHIETNPLICGTNSFLYDNGLRHERVKCRCNRCNGVTDYIWIICGLYNMYNNGLHNHCYYYYYYHHYYYYYHSYD